MNWLWVALSAYFLNAVAVTGDTILLRRVVPEPLRYATYTGFVSIFALVLAPWGFALPTVFGLGLAALTGWVFLASLACIFALLREFEPSRAAPVFGAIGVFVLFVAERALLAASFGPGEIAAIALLTAGAFLLAYRGAGGGSRRFAALVAAAGALQALYFLLAKVVFIEMGFVNGFIWTRVAAFVGAAALWVWFRRRARAAGPRFTVRVGAAALANRTVAGAGSLLVNYAVALGSPTLVNALRGSEYAFLFLIAFVLSMVAPRLLTEELRAKHLVEKVAGLVAVGAALAILALERS